MFGSSGNRYFKNVFKGVRLKPRGFDYMPKYYNPEEEARQARIDFVREEVARAEKRNEEFRISGMDHSEESFFGLEERLNRRRANRKKLILLILVMIGAYFCLERFITVLFQMTQYMSTPS